MSFDFGEPKENDPTADFLAREREAAGVLSGDADLFSAAPTSTLEPNDFERSVSAFPALGDEGIPSAASSQPPAAVSSGFGFDDEPTPTSNNVPSVHVEDEDVQDARTQFEKSFPDLDEPTAPRQPSFDGGNSNGFVAAPVRTPSYYNQDDDAVESEPVRLWREKQQDNIARRDAEAERKKAEAASKAERDIDQFYAEYNAKKEKDIAKNKEDEAKFQEERQQDLAEGTTWSRVCKVVELQNSQSKTIARTVPGASDLSRMKEVYLSLRREGETAPGASGY